MLEIKDIEKVNEVIQEDLVVLITKTRNCSVCTPISQRLELLMKDYPAIPCYSIYTDELEVFSGQFLVFTVPTIFIFSQGKELLRESRFVEFNNIKRLLMLFTS